MKDEEKARQLLSELKAQCETEFEKLSVERPEKAIFEPPQVEVLDNRRQKFCGKIYFRGKDGYYFTNSNLHVAVYECYHGEIPKDYQVHHGEKGVDCNAPENLELKSRSDHAKYHFDKVREGLKSTRRECRNCGAEFVPNQSNQVFCSPQCQIRHQNRNKKVTLVERQCEVCGKTFTTKDRCNFTTQTCSRSCAGKLARQKSPIDNRERDKNGRFKRKNIETPTQNAGGIETCKKN